MTTPTRPGQRQGYGRDRFVDLAPDVMGMLDIYLTEVWLDASPDHDYLWVVLRQSVRNHDGIVTYGHPLNCKAMAGQFKHYSER